MEELDRLDALYDLGALPPAAVPRRRARIRVVPAVLSTVVLVMAVVVLHPASPGQAMRRMVGLGDARVLQAPAVQSRGGVFAFSMTQTGSDEPVGWDPCRPIRFQVNPDGEPAGGRDLIERALSRASAASGLAFEEEPPTDQRPFAQPFVPFGTDRPVTIGWGTADEFPALADDVAGIGGGSAEQGGLGRTYFVTGGVALDTDVFTSERIAEESRVMEAIVLHEIAHVLGLGHVNEPTELMAEANGGQIDFGPGDLEGLARLGSVPCA